MTCVDVTENDESGNMANEKRMHDIAVAVGLMVENCTLKPDLEDLVLGAKSLRRRFEQLRATAEKQAAELDRLRGYWTNSFSKAETPEVDKCKRYRCSSVAAWDHDQPVWVLAGEARTAAAADVTAAVVSKDSELERLRAFAERVRVAAHAISDGEAVTLVTLALAALDKASKGESR